MLVPQSRISYLAPGSLQHSSERDRRNLVGGRPHISFHFFHHAFARANGLFQYISSISKSTFSKHTPHHKSQCNLSFTLHASWYFFCTSVFLILLFGHLGDQCVFALIVLVSLRFFIIFPPSPITTLYSYHRFVAPALVPEIWP